MERSSQMRAANSAKNKFPVFIFPFSRKTRLSVNAEFSVLNLFVHYPFFFTGSQICLRDLYRIHEGHGKQELLVIRTWIILDLKNKSVKVFEKPLHS